LSGSFNQSHSSNQKQSSSTAVNQQTGVGTQTTTTTTTNTTTNTLSGRAGLNIDTPEVNHYEATNNASIAGVTLAQIDGNGQPVNGGKVAVEGNLNTDINTAQKAQVKQDDKMKPMNIGITTPDIRIAQWEEVKKVTGMTTSTKTCIELGTCPPSPPPGFCVGLDCVCHSWNPNVPVGSKAVPQYDNLGREVGRTLLDPSGKSLGSYTMTYRDNGPAVDANGRNSFTMTFYDANGKQVSAQDSNFRGVQIVQPVDSSGHLTLRKPQ
jgi:hypothetical protein